MSCGPLPPLQRRAAPQRRRPLLAARCDAARPSMAHAARPQSNLQATCASLSRYSGCAPAAAPPNLSRSERRSAEAPRPLAETRSDRRQQHHGEPSIALAPRCAMLFSNSTCSSAASTLRSSPRLASRSSCARSGRNQASYECLRVAHWYREHRSTSVGRTPRAPLPHTRHQACATPYLRRA